MISPAVIDDQDLPISFERTSEQNLPGIGGNDLRAGSGADRQSLGGTTEPVILTIALDDPSGHWVEHAPMSPGVEWLARLRPANIRRHGGDSRFGPGDGVSGQDGSLR